VGKFSSAVRVVTISTLGWASAGHHGIYCGARFPEHIWNPSGRSPSSAFRQIFFLWSKMVGILIATNGGAHSCRRRAWCTVPSLRQAFLCKCDPRCDNMTCRSSPGGGWLFLDISPFPGDCSCSSDHRYFLVNDAPDCSLAIH